MLAGANEMKVSAVKVGVQCLFWGHAGADIKDAGEGLVFTMVRMAMLVTETADGGG